MSSKFYFFLLVISILMISCAEQRKRQFTVELVNQTGSTISNFSIRYPSSQNPNDFLDGWIGDGPGYRLITVREIQNIQTNSVGSIVAVYSAVRRIDYDNLTNVGWLIIGDYNNFASKRVVLYDNELSRINSEKIQVVLVKEFKIVVTEYSNSAVVTTNQVTNFAYVVNGLVL